MKAQFKYPFLVIFSAFILAACAGSREQPMAMTEGSPGTISPEDVECSDLQSANARLNCTVQVKEVVASAVAAEIIDTFDINRCDELPPSYAENCQRLLSETGVIGPVSREERELFSGIMSGNAPESPEEGGVPATFLSPEYDSDQCAQLKATGYREYCEKRIQERISQNQLDEIIQSGDPDRCSELSERESRFHCQEFFGLTGGGLPQVPNLGGEDSE